MKHTRFLLTCITLLLNTTFVFAAAPEYYAAVLSSEALKTSIGPNSNIISIKHQGTYRCLGCYDFAIRYTTPSDYEIKKIILQTSQNWGSFEIQVKINN